MKFRHPSKESGMQQEPREVKYTTPVLPGKTGAPASFEEAYLQFAPLLRKIAVKKFGIPVAEAEPLVHDVFATEPASIAEGRRREIEAHLAMCPECQEAHDFFVIRDDEADEALGEDDTWEPMIGSATYAALMDYGARVAEEDREAEILLKEY